MLRLSGIVWYNPNPVAAECLAGLEAAASPRLWIEVRPERWFDNNAQAPTCRHPHHWRASPQLNERQGPLYTDLAT